MPASPTLAARVEVGPFAASVCHSWGGGGPPFPVGLRGTEACGGGFPRVDHRGGAHLLDDAVRHQLVGLHLGVDRVVTPQLIHGVSAGGRGSTYAH